MSNDSNRGVYGKFDVKRVDGSSAPGGKHEHCGYFVLDLEHDEFAKTALRAYADACRDKYPELANDLIAIIGAAPCCNSPQECFHESFPRTPSEALDQLVCADAARTRRAP